MLAASAMEGSRTTLDETVMPPPSTPRGVKRKTVDKEATLPVRTSPVSLPETMDMNPKCLSGTYDESQDRAPVSSWSDHLEREYACSINILVTDQFNLDVSLVVACKLHLF